jgi:hypothetical protein
MAESYFYQYGNVWHENNIGININGGWPGVSGENTRRIENNGSVISA